MQILKNIFSVRNGSNARYKSKILTIFGLKFKFKIKPPIDYLQRYEYLIQSHWAHKGTTKELLAQFDLIYNPATWFDFNYTVWLIYISSLLETNQENKALEVLKFYIKKYNLNNIETLLPVANFAHRLGYTNEKIKIASDFFIEFEKNKNLIYESLIGKRVAIIGNGPQETGKGGGKSNRLPRYCHQI